MKREKNEFLGLLCNLYMIVLAAALPLYTGEGYWMLGDTKYILFRNVSYLCLGCWLVLGMPGRVRAVRKWLGYREGRRHTAAAGSGRVKPGHTAAAGSGRVKPCEKSIGSRKGAAGRKESDLTQDPRRAFSMVDCAVAAYGGCVAVSAICSSYGQLAWTGYNEWYMGAISQLMFVGIYFFVSRQYEGAKYPIYLGEAAVFLVTLLGLLHRLGIDPLGLKVGWNSGDWEYNHMLSTLGNINWLCGFYSVALAWLLAHFMGERKRWREALLYLASVAAFVLLGIQGSQGGLLILGVGAAACIVLGWGQGVVVRKLALLLAGFFACMPFIDWLTKLRGKMAAVAVDGNIFEGTVWYGWIGAAIVCMCVYVLSRTGIFLKLGIWGKENRKCTALCITIAVLVAAGICAGGLSYRFFMTSGNGLADIDNGNGTVLSDTDDGGQRGGLFGMDDSFGSGRGFLWRIALEGFSQAGWKDKLLGAGPDCYGEAVFNRLGSDTDVWNGEHWEGAIFTNAHNEILSQLINVGILGTMSYLAIFLTGLWRYWGRRKVCGHFRYGRWLGVLAITMYGAHSLISFQQVLNAPLLFLTLGLCEYEMREECRADNAEHTEGDRYENK